MPRVQVNDIEMNYETQGSGDPLILIPYLAADQAYYAFQLPDLSERYTCITVDLRGAGESDKPDEPYSTDQYADDLAGLMDALGIERAHVAGVSLGAATGLWPAIKHPNRVATLGVRSAWTRRDLVTPPRLVDVCTRGIREAEVVVFEHLSHAGLHEDAATFNQTAMEFLGRHPL